MPRGGRLLLRTREAKDWKSGTPGLILTVADTGSGMSRATQQKIYEAVITTKSASGPSLGLWISAEIMRRHGGRILIRSSQQPNRSGTVVNLFLPFQTT